MPAHPCGTSQGKSSADTVSRGAWHTLIALRSLPQPRCIAAGKAGSPRLHNVRLVSGQRDPTDSLGASASHLRAGNRGGAGKVDPACIPPSERRAEPDPGFAHGGRLPALALQHFRPGLPSLRGARAARADCRESGEWPGSTGCPFGVRVGGAEPGSPTWDGGVFTDEVPVECLAFKALIAYKGGEGPCRAERLGVGIPLLGAWTSGADDPELSRPRCFSPRRWNCGHSSEGWSFPGAEERSGCRHRQGDRQFWGHACAGLGSC